MSSQSDIAVLGGGLSGIGTALALAEKGYRVALIESRELGSGTSANSHKIIHGGLRYLQNLQLLRAIRSLRDQQELLRDYPGIIKPLPSVMPLNSYGMKSRVPALLGSLLYRSLGIISSAKWLSTTVIPSFDNRAKLPWELENRHFLYWEDAWISDYTEFINTLRRRLEALDVVITEGIPVTCVKLLPDDQYEVALESERTLQVRGVVNTLGPSIQEISIQGFVRPTLFDLGWCRAFNLVFSKPLVEETALAVNTDGGRNYFITPRSSGSAIGTAYLPLAGASGVTEEECARFIHEVQTALPDLNLDVQDIEKIEWGVLPCRGGDPSALYGSEKILQVGRYVELISTKLTTFLSQGRRIASKVAQNLTPVTH